MWVPTDLLARYCFSQSISTDFSENSPAFSQNLMNHSSCFPYRIPPSLYPSIFEAEIRKEVHFNKSVITVAMRWCSGSRVGEASLSHFNKSIDGGNLKEGWWRKSIWSGPLNECEAIVSESRITGGDESVSWGLYKKLFGLYFMLYPYTITRITDNMQINLMRVVWTRNIYNFYNIIVEITRE